MQPVDWDTAATARSSRRMRDVQNRHGAASVAFLSTGQIPTEEMALLGAFAKFEMGVVHGDGNTRQCMATSAVAHKQSFGFDSPPFTYDDLELSDVIVLVGSNLCVAHPILWERICPQPAPSRDHRGRPAAHRDRRGRPPSTCALARRPTSRCSRGGPSASSSAAAVDRDVRSRPYEWVRRVRRFMWSPGRLRPVPRRPACRPSRSTGSRETIHVGRASVVLVDDGRQPGPSSGAHRTGDHQPRPHDRQHRATWHRRELDHRPVQRDGIAAVREHDEPARWTGFHERCAPPRSGRNPRHRPDTHPRPSRARRTTRSWRASRTAPYARFGSLRRTRCTHGSTGPGEGDSRPPGLPRGAGHVRRHRDRRSMLTSCSPLPGGERRTGRSSTPSAGSAALVGLPIRPARHGPTSTSCAYSPGRGASAGGWTRGTPRSTCSRSCNCSPPASRVTSPGSVGTRTSKRSGIQWPYPVDAGGAEVLEGEAVTHRRLFADGQFFHPDGRARFITEAPETPPERPSAQYPLVMLTGRRSSSEWHTGTRTSRSAVLRALDAGPHHRADPPGRTLVGARSTTV